MRVPAALAYTCAAAAPASVTISAGTCSASLVKPFRMPRASKARRHRSHRHQGRRCLSR